MGQVVLVTGVSRYLGGRMARILTEQPDVDRVIGVDVIPPVESIGGAEFVRADIRNPIIAKVIRAAKVDTVVHMGVIATPMQAGGRMSMKEINVIGTMQLLAACQKAPTLSRLVVKSSTGVYGAGPKDPALFTEEMAPKHPPRSGWAKDSVEVEGYVRGFARRRPDVTVSTLRFANFIGPNVVTPMTEFFSLPVIPTVLGYDARLQFVHEDDGLAAMLMAVTSEKPSAWRSPRLPAGQVSRCCPLPGRCSAGLVRLFAAWAWRIFPLSKLISSPSVVAWTPVVCATSSVFSLRIRLRNPLTSLCAPAT